MVRKKPEALRRDTEEAPTIDRATEVEQWPIGRLKAYKRNAKMHPPEQIALLARIMQRHGFDQPIVVDARGTIVKGHGRWLAATELKMPTVPVIVRDLTPAQAAEARIADNRVAEFGWDFDALVADVVANLKAGLDVDTIGWSLADLGLETRAAELVLENNVTENSEMRYSVIVDFVNEEEQGKFLGEQEAKGRACRLLIS